MQAKLEAIIRSLVSQGKFSINESHIIKKRAYRGFSIDEVTYTLSNGFLHKIQKPHRALWACKQVDHPTNLVILSLWILDVNGEFAIDWFKSNTIIIDLIYVKTAYRKDLP